MASHADWSTLHEVPVTSVTCVHSTMSLHQLLVRKLFVHLHTLKTCTRHKIHTTAQLRALQSLFSCGDVVVLAVFRLQPDSQKWLKLAPVGASSAELSPPL